MKPLYGVKRKQANQPNHRVGCQNAPTCFSRRKHIQLNGGCMSLSILLQEVLCSPVCHWIRGAWAVQDKTTLPGISEEGLWVLALALRQRPETAAWLTTEVGHLLASLWSPRSSSCPWGTTHHIFSASQVVLSLSLLPRVSLVQAISSISTALFPPRATSPF